MNDVTLGNWCAIGRRKREGGTAALNEDERAGLMLARLECSRLGPHEAEVGDAMRSIDGWP